MNQASLNHTQNHSLDLLIIGGGIVGSWCLNYANRQGLRTVLFENNTLGGKQSLASQGIIHGGLKYSLNGSLSQATQAIANMPNVWQACLDGNGPVDLQGLDKTCEHFTLWSGASLGNKLASFFGSRALRGKTRKIPVKSYPEFFNQSHQSGELYELPDFTLEPLELIEKLLTPVMAHCYQTDITQDWQIVPAEMNHFLLTHTPTGNRLTAKNIICCAGEQNERIAKLFGTSLPMQTRPLKMISATGKQLKPLFTHAIQAGVSLTPAMTITSHTINNQLHWYIGGQVAEEGVHLSDEATIANTMRAVRKWFPWVDTQSLSWKVFSINRAEPLQTAQKRPDEAFVHSHQSFHTIWPTKLALTPNAAEQVFAKLTKASKDTRSQSCVKLSYLSQAKLGHTPWF